MTFDLDLLRQLFENVSDGIYIVDSNGFMIFVNKAFLNFLGEEEHQVLGENVYGMKEAGKISVCVTDLVMKAKKPITRYQDITTPAGKKYRQLLTSTPIFDNDGNVEYVVAVVRSLDWIYNQLREAHSNLPKIEYESGNETTNVICASSEMRSIMDLAFTLSKVSAAVLLMGESGVGKDVVARYIHANSDTNKPMMTINCAALPENLLEAELFGFVKGSFTGATADKPGLFELADNSTLFLDEINSLPLSLQGKLLLALESHEVKRIGATKSKRIQFRLICGTNEDLLECVRKGTFREDLYYRINVVALKIPPLRNRKDDIRPLIDQFLSTYCKLYGLSRKFSASALAVLEAYQWPGNVRQLRNIVERMVITASSDTIDVSNLPPEILNAVPVEGNDLPLDIANFDSPDFSLQSYMDFYEKAIVKHALQRAGSTRKAAQLLKIDQSSVVRKKNKFNL